MKQSTKVFASAFAALSFLSSSNAFAAGVIDSVSTGARYANTVFYSLNNGTVKSVANTDWDIAFEARRGSGTSAGIRINDAAGLELWAVPNSSADTWSKPLDTTGMSTTWQMWHNSFTTWSLGAFNRDSKVEEFNFGWGEYNLASHSVLGSTVFVINYQKTAGSPKKFKKVFIDALEGGVYTVKISDLDAKNEVTFTVDRKEYVTRNFAYYNIENNKVIYDAEPEMPAWDLVFGKYVGLTPDNSGNLLPYTVNGVRMNYNTEAATVISKTPLSTSAPTDTAQYSKNIQTIGHLWKYFDNASFAWTLSDSSAYFVRTQMGDVYRIVFTKFGGSANGTVVFNKEKMVSVTSVDEATQSSLESSIYPSVISAGEAVQLAVTSNQNRPYSLEIYSVTGERIYTQSGELTNFQALTVPSTSLRASGLYFVTVKSGNQITTHKLIVQ